MKVMVSDIQRATEEHFRLPAGTMSQIDAIGTRVKEHVRARHMAMLLSRRITGKGYSTLGRLFQRDHSTIIHGIRTARRRCLDDRDLIAALCTIRAKVIANG
jgi:chromosomal replication initiator protein